ncbi:MAG: hypothetical protein HKN07_12265 [Acidimicrobiia bacterium]|nr:hypothetical protein [Acidimicrobiia bacterium]
MQKILVGIMFIVAACGGAAEVTTIAASGDGAVPAGSFAVRASSDLGVGQERLLVGIVAENGQRLGSPDLDVTMQIWPQDDPEAAQNFDADFLWIVPEVSGIYKADVEFDRPGIWAVTLLPEGGPPLEPVGFSVLSDTASPSIGEAAPASQSPSVATHAIEDISTDDDPDPRFYAMSVAEAVTSGRQSVIVFATPQFCQTAACGPMLDDVKAAASSHPEVNFVHVEVFTGFSEPGFAPNSDHLAPAVLEWGLVTEPWVFVVDGSGTVTHRFEGVMDSSELDAALS